MKQFVSLIIGCSLAFAGAVIAQPPETQESPAAKKKAAPTEKVRHGPETNPQYSGPHTKTPETGAMPRGAGKHEHAGAKIDKTGHGATGAEMGTGSGAAVSATHAGNEAQMGHKGRKAHEEAAAGATSGTGTTGMAAAGVAGANANARIAERNVGRSGKKVEAQQVQQIKQQHASFKAQPKPNVAPAVTFNESHRIEGSEHWQGQQYEVFRSYHPEWHDSGWYHSNYARVELIGGGWYFWNAGYWYPAWGYDSAVAYYPYDGPIYVGHRAEPPDRVIADVQAELKDMGYYEGEVDGLLGPLTRQALRDYQTDHALEVTEAIDEPTLDSLQLS
jgi:hypothetical protein